MRKERYDKLLESTAAEFFTEVHSIREYISSMFAGRHDCILTLKSTRRCLKRNIKECRQQSVTLVALKKQIAQPVMYVGTAGKAKERCLNCGEDLEDKEWRYNYCPYCGQRLEWSGDK